MRQAPSVYRLAVCNVEFDRGFKLLGLDNLTTMGTLIQDNYTSGIFVSNLLTRQSFLHLCTGVFVSNLFTVVVTPRHKR